MSKDKTAVAKANYIRMSPSKVMRVANLVRGKKLNDSKQVLRILPHKGAKLLFDLLNSAEANAKNNLDLNPERLVISKLLVNEGPRLKRSQARARGRVFAIIKRTCHLVVELEERK
ncbi:50S ribosomal protein L22 [bacterium]|jgi:large subunit ribosomal protein L22|nr:50S ribosomal protein L22 [bacterium]